jgi:predicted nuclease with TOPRIM domain
VDIQVDMNKVLERVQAQSARRIADLERENAYQGEALEVVSAKCEELEKQLDELAKLIPSEEKAATNGKIKKEAAPEPVST